MPINAEMKEPYLRKLKCAYTGAAVTVRMSGTKAAARLFFVTGAVDPGEWRKSAEELMVILGTREGVVGAARDGAELLCPYTGKKMAIERSKEFGFRAIGGYRPTQPVTDPFKLAADMMTRGGVTPKNAPKPARVTAARIEDVTPDAERTQVATDDEALQEAENILKNGMPVKTSVTVIKPQEG